MIFSVSSDFNVMYSYLPISVIFYPLVLSYIFLDISIEHKGYQCNDPVVRHVCISHHVEFDESQPYFPIKELNLNFLITPGACSSVLGPPTTTTPSSLLF